MKHLIVTLFVIVCCAEHRIFDYLSGWSNQDLYELCRTSHRCLTQATLWRSTATLLIPAILSSPARARSVNKITIRGIRVNGLRPVISGGTNTVEFRLV